jgi:PhzF family phenazine biosynthesis protein
LNQKIYQVDAFASKLYEGNPAGVCVLDKWISDDLMQRIAMENNLAETAFLVADADESYRLRWFTPTVEVDLCGHATLAASHILYTEYGYHRDTIVFNTKSGVLNVQKYDANLYMMDFPSDEPLKVEAYDHIAHVMNVNANECYRGKDDYLLILEDEQSVVGAQPDLGAMSSIDSRGIILSAVGDEKDFVSRCFFPNVGVDEDPVTGSAHTLLTPYWAKKLAKNKLKARQLSHRGGDIDCIYKGARVSLIGSAVTYLSGMINIEDNGI